MINRKAWICSRPLWFRLPRLFRVCWITFSLILGPFQRRWRFDSHQIRVILLVRDLYSPLPSLVDSFLAQGIKPQHIILIDSGTTQPKCVCVISDLVKIGCRCISLSPNDQSYGPYAAWMTKALRREVNSWQYPYLVSDTDLKFPDEFPEDWLFQLFNTLNSCRSVLKVALPLNIADLSVQNSADIQAHEASLYGSKPYKLLSRLLLPAGSSSVVCTTDTTLALYRPSPFFSTFSIRLGPRFCINHLPWYKHFCISSEFEYYQKHKLPLFGEWS